jgi:hypothetical protein
MLPTPSKIVPVPVRVKYPNRYSGGYDSSIVTDKVKRLAQTSTRTAPLNGNSDPGINVYYPPQLR